MISPLATGMCVGLGAAAGAGLAVGAYAYASLWPGSRIFGAALTAPARPGELALTFDDGPNATWTPRLLDILAEDGVRATFFLLGSRAAEQSELVRRIATAGHTIGNHSWSHPNLARTRASRVRKELRQTSETLQQIIGAPVKFFRPPFGARRPVVFRVARELGMEPVLWNAMTSDWSEPSADRIAEQLMKKIDGLERNGRAANIVLHDGGHRDVNANREPSVTAARLLLERYAKSHRFLTLDAWAGDVAAVPTHG
ncbi:MAG: polysaccharide deacetylase family protein [Terracidiphilus sp.]|jgi:peptidoglycan/xylan/chitin deacetylase (PgdA/CDA1 family)